MPLSTPVLAVVGTAAGAVAAVVAYQTGAGAPADAAASIPATASAPSVTGVPAAAPVPARRVVWKDCEKGTHLRRGTCVRVRTKVVVVEDPAPVAVAAPAPVEQPAAAPVAAAPARTQATRSTGQHAGPRPPRDLGDAGSPEPADHAEHPDASEDHADDHGSDPSETDD